MFSLKLWSGPTCLRRIWQSYLSKIEYKGSWRWVVWRYMLRFVESPKLSFTNTSNKKIKTCSVTGTWIRIFCLLLYSWTTQSTSLFTTKSCEKSRIKLKTNHRVFNITENLQPKNYLCRQSLVIIPNTKYSKQKPGLYFHFAGCLPPYYPELSK